MPAHGLLYDTHSEVGVSLFPHLFKTLQDGDQNPVLIFPGDAQRRVPSVVFYHGIRTRIVECDDNLYVRRIVPVLALVAPHAAFMSGLIIAVVLKIQI